MKQSMRYDLPKINNPVYFDDELAVSVICDPSATESVYAPIMPGSVSEVGIVDIKEVQLGETIELNGPGALAFDGERDFVRLLFGCIAATYFFLVLFLK